MVLVFRTLVYTLTLDICLLQTPSLPPSCCIFCMWPWLNFIFVTLDWRRSRLCSLRVSHTYSTSHMRICHRIRPKQVHYFHRTGISLWNWSTNKGNIFMVLITLCISFVLRSCSIRRVSFLSRVYFWVAMYQYSITHVPEQSHWYTKAHFPLTSLFSNLYFVS
jgi:hypothetical protein